MERLSIAESMAMGKTAETMKWATLGGFGKYEISDSGLVRNANTGAPMLDYDDGKNGYRKIKLRDDTGKRVMFYVHRLVWTAFKGPIRHKDEIDHMDGNRVNNALDNLMSVTHRQNSVLKKQRNSACLFNRKDERRGKNKGAKQKK